MSQEQLFPTRKPRPRPAYRPCEECGAEFDVDFCMDNDIPGFGFVAAYLCLDCRERLGWLPYNPSKVVIPF